MGQKRKQRVRKKGKISLSRYFQKLEKGQRVAVIPEASLIFPFPLRFRGMIGVVEAKKGASYIVKVKDGKSTKRLILRPIHLKKLS